MMMLTQSRRRFMLGTLGAVATACGGAKTTPTVVESSVAVRSLPEIEASVGGRLGVFAVDTATGRELAHRADERFAMASTFKWILAAAVLASIGKGELSWDQPVPYGPSDLLEYAPVATQHIEEGEMTIEALAEAIITLSDNTAANLLLAKVGGPAGLTKFMRACGDPITRLDRDEPMLNSNLPDDPRDTTSPRAMVGLMHRILCRPGVLAPMYRAQLWHWLRASQTGKNRLRAGFPRDWIVGDKTGTSNRNAVNDVAVAVRKPETGSVDPERAHLGIPPILVAVYMSESPAESVNVLEAAHAEVARLVGREFATVS
jgi:beta-lactamase class A